MGVQFTSLAMIAVFSVGTAGLEAGGAPDAALHAADKAMYEAKSARAGAPAWSHRCVASASFGLAASMTFDARR